MTNTQTSDSLDKHRTMSFFSFLTDNYELSKFILPKKKPINDLLDNDEKKRLVALMEEKDFYEINSIIRTRYSVK
jgi:hypothetical protein